MAERNLERSLQRGVTVIFILAVLTVLEFIVALNAGSVGNFLIMPIALAKAIVIVREFMHLAELWGSGG